jgi:chemotaxis protein methyltransferase CheR
VIDLRWRELQRLFLGWTGNRLGKHASRIAMEALDRVADRQRMTPDDCLRALQRGELRAEREALVERLVNRTTWFLRDARGIHALVDQVGRSDQREVNVWVAGCATGQEPYTLTMALLDRGLSPRVLATDISREALAAAEAGRYRRHELERVPEAWKARYFLPIAGDEMVIAPRVRACIRFQRHNLATALPASLGWDAVVCRNVLLYFERDHAVSIIRELNASTAFLLLSPVEQPLAWLAQARRIEAGNEVVLLRGEPARPIPSRRPARAPAAPAVAAPPIVKRAPTSLVHEVIGRACEHLGRGELDDAIARCDEAIAADQLFPAAHLAKGLALKRAGRFAEAIAVLRCARFLTHDEAWLAPYTLARCLERAADVAGAVEAYRHALAIIEGGGAAGLAPWDPAIDAFGRTAVEACKARLTVLAPGDVAGARPLRAR